MDKVQHFEIAVEDTGRARKFYENTFGWKTQDFPMPNMEYIGMHTGPVDEKMMPTEPGYINGGMFKRAPQFPMQNITMAITVEDINVTLEKVKSQGGQVLGEVMTVADMGLYAYIKDTEGNIIGVWQNLKKM